MMILNYHSKKELKTMIGKELDFTETSLFGPEFNPNGTFCGCNRPQLDGYPKHAQRRGCEFFASVTMQNGLIKKIS